MPPKGLDLAALLRALRAAAMQLRRRRRRRRPQAAMRMMRRRRRGWHRYGGKRPYQVTAEQMQNAAREERERQAGGNALNLQP